MSSDLLKAVRESFCERNKMLYISVTANRSWLGHVVYMDEKSPARYPLICHMSSAKDFKNLLLTKRLVEPKTS